MTCAGHAKKANETIALGGGTYTINEEAILSQSNLFSRPLAINNFQTICSELKGDEHLFSELVNVFQKNPQKTFWLNRPGYHSTVVNLFRNGNSSAAISLKKEKETDFSFEEPIQELSPKIFCQSIQAANCQTSIKEKIQNDLAKISAGEMEIHPEKISTVYPYYWRNCEHQEAVDQIGGFLNQLPELISNNRIYQGVSYHNDDPNAQKPNQRHSCFFDFVTQICSPENQIISRTDTEITAAFQKIVESPQLNDYERQLIAQAYDKLPVKISPKNKKE